MKISWAASGRKLPSLFSVIGLPAWLVLKGESDLVYDF